MMLTQEQIDDFLRQLEEADKDKYNNYRHKSADNVLLAIVEAMGLTEIAEKYEEMKETFWYE